MQYTDGRKIASIASQRTEKLLVLYHSETRGQHFSWYWERAICYIHTECSNDMPEQYTRLFRS